MPPIKVPSNLPELVRNAFNRAKSNGDITYYPTQVTVLHVNSIPFQLRFSPALANKPKPPKPDSSKAEPETPFNPFESPSPELVVADLPPGHVLVLNKFAVVPEHFILVTKSFKQQTHLLEADDLAAALACVRAYRESKSESESAADRDHHRADADADTETDLFAFFNSGPHSGASQPHRHLQLLPVARMRDGLGARDGWAVLADQLAAGKGRGERLPFRTFAERIHLRMEPADLHAAYGRLYRAACAAVEGRASSSGGDEVEGRLDGGNGNGGGGEEARISYNLALTGDAMVLCPRVAEGAPLELATAEGNLHLGSLALNGTVLAGTALVKTQAEWEALQHDEAMLGRVLARIGLPPEQ